MTVPLLSSNKKKQVSLSKCSLLLYQVDANAQGDPGSPRWEEDRATELLYHRASQILSAAWVKANHDDLLALERDGSKSYIFIGIWGIC